MFKKLQRKILLLNMTLISVVMLLAFVTVYITTWHNVQSDNQRKLSNMNAPTMMTNIEGQPHPGESGAEVSHMVSSDYALSFSVEIDDNWNILSIDSIIDMPQEIYATATRMALESGKDSGVITLMDKDWLYKVDYLTLIQMENGIKTETKNDRYIIFLDITESGQTMRNLLLTLSAVAIAVIMIFYFISLFFSHRVINPIAEAWSRQNQFVADASHELKTPLSIINANRDAILENRHETVESQIKWLDYIRAGTDRMSKLISQLLLLAKMDDISDTLKLEGVVISLLVKNTADSMEAVVREKKINLICYIEQNIEIKSDREKLSIIITILLDNAVKYANSSIDIKLAKEKRHIIFSVKNDGAGISREDLPKIFDRFYRGDKARRGGDGYGLGLSIAKTLTQRLNGKIYAESKLNDYTKITVILPCSIL